MKIYTEIPASITFFGQELKWDVCQYSGNEEFEKLELTVYAAKRKDGKVEFEVIYHGRVVDGFYSTYDLDKLEEITMKVLDKAQQMVEYDLMEVARTRFKLEAKQNETRK